MDVRFGSKSDTGTATRHVRFTPESKHVQCDTPCLLRAKSGHGHAHYSITSAARATSAGGIVRSIAFAVLRLTISSYLVAACTGRLAGFSSLRMRWTYSAACWYGSIVSAP